MNLTNNTIPKFKKMKILLIGNSFSTDIGEYLFDICQSADIEITVGISFDSGVGLKKTWEKLKKNESVTAYQKWDNKNLKTEVRPGALKDIIKDEPWNVVTFQQVSNLADNSESFYPYLLNLKNYVELNIQESIIEYGLNMTWAFSNTSARIKKMGYQNQVDLYNGIVQTHRKIMNDINFDFFIPAGTAIQNARTNTSFKNFGDDLTRDGSHLDKDIGRYITALVMFEVVVNKYYKKDIFTDIKFEPLGHLNLENITYLSKMAAKKAAEYPFTVTEI